MSKNLIITSEGRDEQLIDLVRQHPELYNHQHPRYNDTRYKQKVWNTIGAFLEEDSLACKARWTNIRDQHRKSIRKYLTKGENKKVRVYKFTSLLGFLKDYIDDIEIKSSWSRDADQESQSSSLPPTTNPAPPPPDEESLDESGPDSDSGNFLDDLIMKDEVIEPDSRASNTTTDPLEASATTHNSGITDGNGPGTTNPTHRIVRRIRRPLLKRSLAVPATITTAATESSPRMLEFLINKLEAAASPDPVDAFLAGLAPVLKNLPPYYWNLVKSEMFSAVQKYEMKMLTEPPPPGNVNGDAYI